jgi:Spy/CpxP family protein refolding chaperone
MTAAFSSAQAQQDKHEKIRTFKTAYLTEQLSLTSSEAEKFWPVYNEYENKMIALKRDSYKVTRGNIEKQGDIDALDEKAAREYMKKILENEQQMTLMKIEMYNRMKPILSSKKILKLYQAEHDFNRRLLDEYRGKKGSH